MTEKKQEPEIPQFSFEPVTDVPAYQPGDSQRDDPGCTYSPSGHSRLNTAGSEILDDLAEKRGLTQSGYHLKYGADVKNKAISVTPMPQGSEGCHPIRRYESGGHTFHVGPLFKKYPSLRPKGKRECAVITGKDADGYPCLIMAMQQALGKRQTTRGSSGVEDGQPEAFRQAAAGKQPPESVQPPEQVDEK